MGTKQGAKTNGKPDVYRGRGEEELGEEGEEDEVKGEGGER